MWMRNLFECSRNVPKDLLYLEIGVIPISFIIKGRKLVFLHHILQQKEESLLFRFFMAQMNFPSHNDWVSSVLEDMKELEIELEIEDIQLMPKVKFKEYVNEKVSKSAFKYIMKRKASRNSDKSKGKCLEYTCLEMSEYLTSMNIELSIDELKWILKCRIEDIDLNSNRKWNNEDNMCKKCPNTVMDQRHLLKCKHIIGKNEILSYIPIYENLFKGDIEDQIYISRLLKENLGRLKVKTTM